MSKQNGRKPAHPASESLPGLIPALRMKGGVRYDPEIKGFVAIVHSWENALGIGQPQEWRAPQIFPTEEAAMQYYKTTVRPELERWFAEQAKSNVKVKQRRLEE